MASFPNVRRLSEPSAQAEGCRAPRAGGSLAERVTALSAVAAGTAYALSELATPRGHAEPSSVEAVRA